MQPPGLSILDVPAPPPLPKPGALLHFTLENPWPAVFFFTLAALIAYSVLRARGQARRGAWFAGALAGLALAIALLAHLVTTSREAMMLATKSLVRAVATCDLPALDSALDDSCVLYYFQAPQGLGKAGILSAVTAAFAPGAPYRVGEVKIEAVHAFTRDGRTGQAQVKVFVKPDQTNFPHHSWWRLDLRKAADNTWRATAIKPLSIQGMDNPGG